MAENDERSKEDLTEEASPYRLEEYRRKGMVAQSREVSGLLALLATGAATYALAPQLGSQIFEFMRDVFRADLSARLDLGSAHIVRGYLIQAVLIAVKVCLPICLAGFILGIAGSFAQIGNIFSTDPITPDFEKIDPMAGFKRIFSGRQAIDGVRLVFKVVAALAASYALMKAEVLRSSGYMGTEPSQILAAYGQLGKVVFLALIGILGVFAVMDFGLQKWEFGKNLRMTKQEAKQEHKEREGDPQIKARIRSIQRDIARRRMMQAVKKATVVITNPTHIAVAVQYEKSMLAPKVVAKGADFLAQRIKNVAAEAGIPMVENVPLARTLFKTVKLNQSIPRALYQAVAEVLAYVYRLKGGF